MSATATHCNTLQHTATHCNTRQHTATHGNTQISPQRNVSSPSHKRVMSHICDGCVSCHMWHMCHETYMCHTCLTKDTPQKNIEALSGGRSHVTHINESHVTHQRVTCHPCDQVHFTCKCVMSHVRMSHVAHVLRMGWLRLIGSLKFKVSIAEYRLFDRSLLPKRLSFSGAYYTKPPHSHQTESEARFGRRTCHM